MLDLWFSEFHAPDAKLSILVKEQLYSEQTPFQKIDFFDSETFGKFFTLDGLIMITEKDEFIYHEMISNVPMAVNPDIKKVLIIGGGDGGTAREVCRFKTVEQVDMVEIDERVVRLCQKYFPQTACALDNDPRINLIFGDGLKLVQDAPEGAYDLILVDSTDPLGPGEGLFTTEFYRNCYRALNDKGILINQHESPYYKEYAYEMRRAHKKLASVFSIATVYQFYMPTYSSGHWLFGFASKGLDPVKDADFKRWSEFGLQNRYYNPGVHLGAFALPNYVQEELQKED